MKSKHLDILVVDDEEDICELLSGILADEGYQCRVANNGSQALREVKKIQPHVVILDVWLGDSEQDGLKILEIIKKDHPFVPVIMISGHSTIETAVKAIKNGAYDFIEKPFQTDRLMTVIARAIETASLKRQVKNLKKTNNSELCLSGSSTAILNLRLQLQELQNFDGSIFLSGQKGTGKEEISEKIHNDSNRKHMPYEVFSCERYHPTIVDAEFFGSEILKNGEKNTTVGAIERANGGTLYLNEIHMLPLPVQAKLQRVLQNQSFKRVGSDDEHKIDVRFIASSSEPTDDLIKQGTVRSDLIYRLSVKTLQVPSLKARSEDIAELTNLLAESVSQRSGQKAPKFTKDAIIVLQALEWPYNYLQLKNVIEALVYGLNENQDTISSETLKTFLSSQNVSQMNSHDLIIMPLREARESFEKQYLLSQINRFAGNVSSTAKFVGMERSALHRKLKSLGIENFRDF